MLGWAASRYPDILRKIAREGHELACHGWAHHPVDGTAEAQFREDVRRAKSSIEDRLGETVLGYRAPRWSMGKLSWPYEVLGELGFQYSSSRLPSPGLGAGPGPAEVGRVLELPALTGTRLGVRVPAGGTVSLRIMPLRWLARARDASLRRGWPAVYWFHPWELMDSGPRLEGGPLYRWVRFAALPSLPGRIRTLVPGGDRRLGPLARDYLAGDLRVSA